jgi:hypothetical protein
MTDDYFFSIEHDTNANKGDPSTLVKQEFAIYAIWHIWKKRCRRVFQNSEIPERQLVEMIKDDILILKTYLQEKRRGEEPGITPALSE